MEETDAGENVDYGVGCLLDLLFGDPHFLWHPVQGIGWLIEKQKKCCGRYFPFRRNRRQTKEKREWQGRFWFLLYCF